MAPPHGIKGYWYDHVSSQRWSALVEVSSAGELVVSDAHHGEALAKGYLMTSGHQSPDWRISPRLANTVRYLYHRDGGTFETQDNAAIDSIQQRFQSSWLTGFVYTLESRKRFLALSTLVVIAFVWGMVGWGVPSAANSLAYRVPEVAVQQLTRETLAVADRSWFSPSQLPTNTRTRLEQHFAPILAAHPHLNIRVLWRQGGPLGANAVALPDGTVVITDELVALAEHDDELAAILLHEIGHIEHRHGLRSMIQSSLVGLGFILLTGDASATAEVLLSAPLIINELSYSRRFEFEADAYAREYLLANGQDLAPFRSILWRLTYGDEHDPQAQAPEDIAPWAEYLSTHPPTVERVERF